MATQRDTPSNPRQRRPLDHYRAVDLGCRLHHLGSLTVWRLIKALSQLIVITFGFWAGLEGAIPPRYAFTGMIIAYFGAEGVEALLAAAGRATFSLEPQPEEEDTDRERPETDGGATVAETPDTDPRGDTDE